MIFGRLRDFLRLFIIKMSDTSCFTFVPDTVRGMKQLDRSKFLRNIKIPVLKLTSDKMLKITPVCNPYLLKLEKFKPVQILGPKDEPFDRAVHLHPGKISSWKDIPEHVLEVFSENDVNEKNFSIQEIQLTYDNFSVEQIFKAVLPEDFSVRGFTQIGHIIHLNLRENLLEYKSVIASVLIDKIITCGTVVNKSSVINNTYRNFEMDVIAGEKDLFVTVKENKCTFQFDFSKVYWNSRLSNEHSRIIDCLQPDDVLFDVFAGVGPFAVPAAKKKCIVYANDLNPESFQWLKHNAKINRVNMIKFKPFNMDGKDFICNIFKEFITDSCTGKEILKSGAKIHVTMNLPAIAVEFLKYFNGLIDDNKLYEKLKHDIIIYLYCFIPGDDQVKNTRQLVNHSMEQDMSSQILKVSFVRNVSPTKEMMKVTIKLSKEMLFGINSKENGEPLRKKRCVEKAINN